jgi:hypothetical protein
MRHAIFLVAFAMVIVLPLRTARADHDMTCHETPPVQQEWSLTFETIQRILSVGEELNLIMPGAGGATSTSCSSAGGDALPVVLPADLVSAVEHIPGAGQAGHYWHFAPVSQAFLEAHLGQSAELPNFTTPDGTPLLAQYSETDLDFLLQLARDFQTGETLSVSGGQIFAWPAVTLREMPGDFDLDELFPPDPGRFPLYSGLAQVADIARISVVPEPASWLLLLGGATAIAGRRRILGRSRHG